MPKLKDCFFEEFLYPCATYVVKRLGLAISPVSLYAYPAEKFEDDGSTTLFKGDVLIWDWNEDTPPTDVVLGMSDQGPITYKKKYGRHFGVYEGNDIVSDITFYGDSVTPFIRQMYLYNKKTNPVEIIRYDTLKDA